MEHTEEHHGIHAAGNGHDNPPAATEEPPLANGSFDLFHQRVHAAMLTRWKSGARGLGVNWDNPTRSDPVRALRQVLCTQSRSGSLRSAAVSAEDQPQERGRPEDRSTAW